MAFGPVEKFGRQNPPFLPTVPLGLSCQEIENYLYKEGFDRGKGKYPNRAVKEWEKINGLLEDILRVLVQGVEFRVKEVEDDAERHQTPCSSYTFACPPCSRWSIEGKAIGRVCLCCA